jgi:hypothetical protein
MQLDIKETYTVCNPSWWRLTKQTIVVVNAVTENGREIQGIGAHVWSKDTATDRAIDNAKQLARDTEVSFKIKRVTVPNQRTSYSFIETQGVVRSEHNPSFGGRPVVEVTVSDGERQADAKGKQGLLSSFGFGWGGQFANAAKSAVEAGAANLQRTGVTTVDS